MSDPKTSFAFGWSADTGNCSYPYLLPMVLGLCRRHGTKKLLDIGAGNGSVLPVWKELGWEVCAMESDADGFGFAKRVSGVDVLNLGVGDPLPAEWHGAFDTVVSLEVVEHLFNPHQLVETASAALGKGGIAIVSTPYHGYLKNLLLSLGNKWDFHHNPLRTGGHIKFWLRSTLTSLFELGPFECIEFHGAGRLRCLWKSMVLVIRKVS
jgi:2-polyprenyl-6-hydroxyphenyl methylase/3-demethylubiquinone-9 3-methyltransferase